MACYTVFFFPVWVTDDQREKKSTFWYWLVKMFIPTNDRKSVHHQCLSAPKTFWLAVLLGKCSAVIIVKFTIVCLHVMHETQNPQEQVLASEKSKTCSDIRSRTYNTPFCSWHSSLSGATHKCTIVSQTRYTTVSLTKTEQQESSQRKYLVIQHSFSLGIKTLAVLTQAHQTLRFKITVRYDGALNHILCDVTNKKIHFEGFL